MASTNGKAERSADKVRVAIIGVGNCASSFVQGVEYYKDAKPGEFVPGLMHVDLGGYHVRDIEFTAAFDVVEGKVGKDLGEAIWAYPNNTIKFADVPKTGITVSRGMTHDGLGKYLGEKVKKAKGSTDDVTGILKETGTDVVVNYLPVGSEEATKWYTEQILNAGCAMVNCMPVFIGREKYWSDRFRKAGLPIIGDDIKSQVGATITHRVLMGIFRDRGVKVDRTFQLNFGGNADFLNMLERERLESKKISKTYSIQSTVPYEIEDKNIHVGPSDHVPWLEDRKWAYIRLEGSAFGDVPLSAELKIEVWDSPNSAGVVTDAVRLTKLALNNGIAGTLEGPSAYLMKSPPVQYPDDAARDLVEDFIAQNARKNESAAAGKAVETASWRASDHRGRPRSAGAVRRLPEDPYCRREEKAECAEDVEAGREAHFSPGPVAGPGPDDLDHDRARGRLADGGKEERPPSDEIDRIRQQPLRRDDETGDREDEERPGPSPGRRRPVTTPDRVQGEAERGHLDQDDRTGERDDVAAREQNDGGVDGAGADQGHADALEQLQLVGELATEAEGDSDDAERDQNAEIDEQAEAHADHSPQLLGPDPEPLGYYTRNAVGLRVCLVTPFAWSRPHDVNDHVRGLAEGLRALGHEVTVLAPSTRAADLVAGRRALLDGVTAEMIALGPALPVSRRSRIGVPVGVRANLALALQRGSFDIVHGFEPALPSLSYLALRDSHALGVATFLSAERLGYPPGRPQRERLLSRIDALLATSPAVAPAAAERLPGDYRVVFPGVDVELFEPAAKRKRIVLEWRPTERPLTRSVLRELRQLPE